MSRLRPSLLLVLLALGAPVLAAERDPASTEIERRLTDGPASLGSETIDLAALRRFYQARHWQPAWGDGAAALAVLSKADQDGLPTRPLHLAAIAKARSGQSPLAGAEADLLLSDAIRSYALAMRGQRVDPTRIEDDWFLPTPAFDAVDFMSRHVADIGQALTDLAPPYEGYALLKDKLIALKAAGDWPKVTPGPSLKPGMSDPRIDEVRKRLAAADEGAPALAEGADPALYDDGLVDAVKAFQRRHGLEDDGVLGRQTVLAMNRSPAQLARQVAINMERWRWLPRKLEDNHIVVNVPGAWLEVVENGKAVMSMRVIVGDVDHPTPALHARVSSIVLNPVWRVPASIATDEILPKLQKDAGYLVANDLELVADGFPPGSPESQGAGIDWRSLTKMPWPVRQRAGSDNALGRIKFNMPNDDDIYLHDTPNRKLFARALRDFSHGCIRVEKPDQLALYLLKDKDWTAEHLAQEIDTGTTRTVPLTRSLPVWLLYWTVWVDGQGRLEIRDDIYERDQRLAEALANPPPPRSAIPAELASRPVQCEGCRVP